MAAITLLDAAERRQVTGEVFRNDSLDKFSIFETAFFECDFVDCVFDGEKIGMSTFHNCRFTECSFRDTRLISCQFNDADAEKRCVWSRCDLSDTTFENCDLSSNQFLACRGFKLRLEKCNFSAVQMNIDPHRHVNARHVVGGISCYRTDLSDADISGQNLEGSKFEICDFRRADLSGCNLSSVNFIGSNLNNARINNSLLTNARIPHADIDELDFTQALDLNDLIISADQRDRMLKHFGIHVLHK